MQARVCLFDTNDPLKAYFRAQTVDSEDGCGRYALPNQDYDFLKAGEIYFYSYDAKIPVVFAAEWRVPCF